MTDIARYNGQKSTICQQCGSTFVQARRGQHYCSGKCGDRARMAKYKAKERRFVSPDGKQIVTIRTVK